MTNWSGTWSQDLPIIQALGANTIRVYCFLDTQLPTQSPPPQTQVFTHSAFLDACYEAGLYVIVGIPMPQSMFVQGPPPQPSAQWWQNVLEQTVSEVANHPAVLGFTIANEVDNGLVDTYAPPVPPATTSPQATYWWNQVQAMALIAKTAAPNKLVGIANHDDPGICQHASSYMAQCPSIDFWGVNTYQPKSFASVFGGSGSQTGYALLTGSALKPVILTEYGFPSTSRVTADTLCPMAGMVNTVTITNGGSDYASEPTVTFAAAPAGGTTATGTAKVSNGAVTSVTLTSNCSGYSSAPTVTITAPTGVGSTATGTATISAGIYSNSTTQAKVAGVLNRMLTAAYAEQLSLGVCYFEYCDEWWNQSDYTIPAGFTCPSPIGPNAPNSGLGTTKPIGPPNSYTQYGGPPACGFPNYYWDNDGFGLFAVAVGQGRNPAIPWDSSTNAPALPLDDRISRSAVVAALHRAFAQLVTVQSNVAWQSTGVTVAPGMTVTVTYQRGLWTANPNDDNGQLFDAAGNPNYVASQPGYTMMGQNQGALIGRIGSEGEVFLVGNGPLTLPSDQSGPTGALLLCINDDLQGQYGAGLKDNIGSVTVTVTTQS